VRRELRTRCDSLWTYVNQVQAAKPSHFANPSYLPKDDEIVLWPTLYRKSFQLWEELYTPHFLLHLNALDEEK
jgi:hypothetical protein